jgi:hypothetical protein
MKILLEKSSLPRNNQSHRRLVGVARQRAPFCFAKKGRKSDPPLRAAPKLAAATQGGGRTRPPALGSNNARLLPCFVLPLGARKKGGLGNSLRDDFI